MNFNPYQSKKLKLEKDHINKHRRCNALPYDVYENNFLAASCRFETQSKLK